MDKYKKDVSAPPPRLVSLPPRETGDGLQSSPPSGDGAVVKEPAERAPEPVAEAVVEEPPAPEPAPVAEAPADEPPASKPVAEAPADESPASKPVDADVVEEPPAPAPVAEAPADKPPAPTLAPTPAAEAPAEDPSSSDPDSHSKCVAHMISQDNVAFYRQRRLLLSRV